MMSGHDTDQALRDSVWRELRGVARPDSRFHWDFKAFIPDFEGSDRCARSVLELIDSERQDGRQIFVTPDNSTEALRAALIARGTPFAMTTYGIKRGLLAIDSKNVPDGEASYAATLDGMDRYGAPMSVAQLAEGAPYGVFVTGGTVVDRVGRRLGKGHGYFDVEWALFCEAGVVPADTAVIIGVFHDCQVIDTKIESSPHDVNVHWIVTPERTLATGASRRQPGRIRWDELAGTEFEGLEILDDLRRFTSSKREA